MIFRVLVIYSAFALVESSATLVLVPLKCLKTLRMDRIIGIMIGRNSGM